MEKVTDLALEARESFPNDHVEVKGVVLEKKWDEENEILTTIVEIKDEKGSRAMKKPKGIYITLESQRLDELDEKEPVIEKIQKSIEYLCPGIRTKRVLLAGLGNEEVTSDSLGPVVIHKTFATRHVGVEYGKNFLEENRWGDVAAISPGVMAQTGMESSEVLKGLIHEIHPQVLIVIDALAARSVSRLATTIQLTNTGIHPGAGVGNYRNELTKETLGIPVIAIGVPTVVDAGTIISDQVEEALNENGFSEHEIEQFIEGLFEGNHVRAMFMTPKNIDEKIKNIGEVLSESLNQLLHNKSCKS